MFSFKKYWILYSIATNLPRKLYKIMHPLKDHHGCRINQRQYLSITYMKLMAWETRWDYESKGKIS
jgi:hypothetical protein